MDRGHNPSELPVKHALAYLHHQDDIREKKKRLYAEAAGEIFGED